MTPRRDSLSLVVVATVAVAVGCGLITALSGLVLFFEPARLTGTVAGGAEGSYARALGVTFCLCGGPFAAFSLAAGLYSQTLRRRALELQSRKARAGDTAARS